MSLSPRRASSLPCLRKSSLSLRQASQPEAKVCRWRPNIVLARLAGLPAASARSRSDTCAKLLLPVCTSSSLPGFVLSLLPAILPTPTSPIFFFPSFFFWGGTKNRQRTHCVSGTILDRSVCLCPKGSLPYKGVKPPCFPFRRGLTVGNFEGSFKEKRYIAGIMSEILECVSCINKVLSGR